MSNVVPIRVERPAEGAVPPHDLDAEASVIGAVLVSQGSVLSVLSGFLRPEHFFSEAHRWAFAACLELAGAGRPIDTQTVASWLKDRDRLGQIGGVPALIELGNAVPVIAPRHVTEYAATVYEKARARKVIATCQRVAALGYVDYGETQDYADDAVRSLATIARAGMGKPVESNVDALRRIIAALIAADGLLARDRVTGIPTGLAPYDALTLGLHAGQKTTIAAWTGVGKTTLALQIASHVAGAGIGVLMFSTEQPRDELLVKLLCHHARIDSDRFKRGRLSTSEWDRILAAQPDVEKLPLWIDDTTELDIQRVRQVTLAHAERLLMVDKIPLGLLVLDYVQKLVPAPGQERMKRHEWIAAATDGFKALCRELKVPGLELAQRKPCEIDHRTKLAPRPSKGCIADSSQIEKSADNLVVLHREPLFGAGGKVVGEDRTAVTVVLLKQRSGAEGSFRTKFAGEFSTFMPLREEDCAPDPQESLAAHHPASPSAPRRPDVVTPAAATAPRDDESLSAWLEREGPGGAT